jgi:hypothetical protein
VGSRKASAQGHIVPLSSPLSTDYSGAAKTLTLLAVSKLIPPGAHLPAAITTLNKGIFRTNANFANFPHSLCDCTLAECPTTLQTSRSGRHGDTKAIIQHGVGPVCYDYVAVL